MITLCGFSLSNYYNKVKMVLLEKGIPFTEERVMTKSKDEAVLGCTPLGKIPYIRTEQGALCESQVIVDYLEALSPQTPADADRSVAGGQGARTGDLHRTAPGTGGARAVCAGLLRRHGQRGDARARAQAAAQAHCRLQAPGEVLALRGGRHLHAGRLRRLGQPAAAWPWRARRCSAKTCWPPPASTGRPTSSSIGERPSAQRVAADRKADAERMAAEAAKKS